MKQKQIDALDVYEEEERDGCFLSDYNYFSQLKKTNNDAGIPIWFMYT